MTDFDNSFEPLFIPDEYLDLCYQAESGDADAQFTLGIKYLTGEDVTKNYRKARKLLLKATEQGHEEALNKLCEMAENGNCWLWDDIATIFLNKNDSINRSKALYYVNKYAEHAPDVIADFKHIDLLVELCQYKEALKILNRDYRRVKNDDNDTAKELAYDIKHKIFEVLPYVRKPKEKAPPKPKQPKVVVRDKRQLQFDFMNEPLS